MMVSKKQEDTCMKKITQWRIYICSRQNSEKERATIRFAAEELKKYLRKMNPSYLTDLIPVKEGMELSNNGIWLTVGAKLNYRNSWRDMKTISDGLEVYSIDRLQAVSVMPTVKFTTGHDSVFRYYATLGVGAGMDLSSGVNDAFVALQFTPVGISVGKKISWYFELGIGHAFMGFMTGISWRF